MKTKRNWTGRQLSRIEFFDRCFTKRERRAKRSYETVEAITEIESATKLWGLLGCFEIETPEGRIYRARGHDNPEVFDLVKKNLGMPIVLSYKKVNTRCSDWCMSLDMFLYHTGRIVKKLTGTGGNYGIPKRYLELVKAETIKDWQARFLGDNI